MALLPSPVVPQVMSQQMKKTKKKKKDRLAELSGGKQIVQQQRSASSPTPLRPLLRGRTCSAPPRAFICPLSQHGHLHRPISDHTDSQHDTRMEVGTPILAPPPLSPATPATPTQMLQLLPLHYPGSLAPSTLRSYLSLATRFEAWAAQEGNTSDLWNQAMWVRFISTLEVKTQGKHQYLKTASAILNLRDRGPLQMAMKGQVAAGALLPVHQAPAILHHELLHPVLSAEILGVMTCWKTASRWDEITRLTRESFLFPTNADLTNLQILPQDIVIVDWLQDTKASRCDPHRASRYAVIVGRWATEIRERVQALPQGAKITNTTTAGLTRLLKTIRPSLSAHSIKAGALDVLAAAVVRGDLEEPIMARMAKHKHHADPSPTTLRYIRNQITAALMLGTAAASMCL